MSAGVSSKTDKFDSERGETVIIRNVCPLRADGVHDCTKGDCPCGYKNLVPRFGWHFDMFDNGGSNKFSGGYMTDDAQGIIEDLRELANKIERELTA